MSRGYYLTAEPLGMCSCPRCNARPPIDEDAPRWTGPASPDAWGGAA